MPNLAVPAAGEEIDGKVSATNTINDDFPNEVVGDDISQEIWFEDGHVRVIRNNGVGCARSEYRHFYRRLHTE
jgi:hypothetical protein